MKQYNFLFISFFSMNLFAQNDSLTLSTKLNTGKTEYLINPNKAKIKTLGLYLSTEGGITQMNKNISTITGGSFMFLINKKIGIGGVATITGNPKNSKEITRLGYGGVKLEYTIKPNSKVHSTISLVMAEGFANNDTLRYRYGSPSRPKGQNHDFGNRLSQNNFFIVEPGVNLEANLVKFIKIFGGVNYRLATKLADGSTITNTSNEISSKEISGIKATIGLKFGLFDYQIHRKDSLRKQKLR